MATTLVSTADCCTPCSGSVTVQTPGTAGDAGAAGAAGTNGVSAFTTTTADFTMPAEGADVTVSVSDSTWITATQMIYVQNAGWMQAQSKAASTSVVLRNSEVTASSFYTENVAPTTVISSGAQLSPGGLQGPAGSAAAAGADASLSYWTRDSEALLTGESNISALANGPIQHVAGTPSIAVLLKAIEALAANGIVTRTSSTTASARTITGTANQITATNGDGVSGNPTLSLHADVYVAGGTDVAVADGGTGASTAAGARTNLGITGAGIGSVYFQDQQTVGVNGGTASAVTWNVRSLVEVYDSGSVGAVVTPNVTLPAGTYRVRAWGVAYQVGTHQIRVKNMTDSSIPATGSSAGSGAAAGDQNTMSVAYGRFTIGGAEVFQLQHYTQSAKTSTGLGLAANATTEVYAGMEFILESV